MAIWVALGAALVLGFAVAVLVVPRVRRQKLVKQIRAGYGRPPAMKNGLFAAEKYWADHSRILGGAQDVDDLTWQDLDMDDVFYRLNTCGSSFGDAWLYRALRQPCAQRQNLPDREAMLQRLEADENTRVELQLLLAELGRSGGFYLSVPRFSPQELAIKHRGLMRLLGLAPLLGMLAMLVSPMVGLFATLLFFGVNITYFEMYKSQNQMGFIVVRYLCAALHTAKKMAPLLAGVSPELGERLQALPRQFKALKRSVQLLNLDEYLTERVNLPDPLSSFQLPLLSYGKFVAHLPRLAGPLAELYEALGEVDVAISVLSARKSFPHWCAPVFREESAIEFQDICHPLVEDAVPNSGQFSRGILVTGSNASGKSTFLKAIAVCCITGQSLGTCTASSFSMRPGCVATSMAVEDSIVEGDSYFVAEIKSMRRLFKIAAEADFSYFFIDEILKGTNTIERIAAAAAVLRYLQEEPCLCFSASHDRELTSILAGEYDNYHFRESMRSGKVCFDYTLVPGPSTSRNAIVLLGSLGFPGPVVENAQDLVDAFEATGSWVGEQGD